MACPQRPAATAAMTRGDPGPGPALADRACASSHLKMARDRSVVALAGRAPLPAGAGAPRSRLVTWVGPGVPLRRPGAGPGAVAPDAHVPRPAEKRGDRPAQVERSHRADARSSVPKTRLQGWRDRWAQRDRRPGAAPGTSSVPPVTNWLARPGACHGTPDPGRRLPAPDRRRGVAARRTRSLAAVRRSHVGLPSARPASLRTRRSPHVRLGHPPPQRWLALFHVKHAQASPGPRRQPRLLLRTSRCPAPCHPCPRRMDECQHYQRSRPDPWRTPQEPGNPGSYRSPLTDPLFYARPAYGRQANEATVPASRPPSIPPTDWKTP
jgi:hypothetical protein